MYYTSAKHKGGGHSMDTSNGVVVYESSSLPHRIVIEACLIAVCNTVQGNQTSTSTTDMSSIAPKILRGAPIKWDVLAACQPSCLSEGTVPKRFRKYFRNFNGGSNNSTTQAVDGSDEATPIIIPRYNLRSGRIV